MLKMEVREVSDLDAIREKFKLQRFEFLYLRLHTDFASLIFCADESGNTEKLCSANQNH